MSKLFKHNRDNQVGREEASLGRPLESGTDSDTEIFRKEVGNSQRRQTAQCNQGRQVILFKETRSLIS